LRLIWSRKSQIGSPFSQATSHDRGQRAFCVPAPHASQDQKHCTFPALDFLCATAQLTWARWHRTTRLYVHRSGHPEQLVSVLDLE